MFAFLLPLLEGKIGTIPVQAINNCFRSVFAGYSHFRENQFLGCPLVWLLEVLTKAMDAFCRWPACVDLLAQ